jgi:hypothetical protein
LNHIRSFNLFEGKKVASVESIESEQEESDRLMGELLHLYGSIPLPKEKSSIVIKKIIANSMGYYFDLGEKVNIEESTPHDHDKVRFKDYFESLLKDKDSRGHNFEGTLAGLFNGKLSRRGEKWDITIDEKTWSVKFLESGSKAPEIGRFETLLTDADLEYEVESEGGLTWLFQVGPDDLKKEVWEEVISSGITGGWIIAYPDDINNPSSIILNIITVDVMESILMNGLTAAPKGGKKEVFNLALSARFKDQPGVIKSSIIIPQLSLKDLREISKSQDENEWSGYVFGKIGSKIRPDVLRFIGNNSEEIGKRLLNLKNFKTFNIKKTN